MPRWRCAAASPGLGAAAARPERRARRHRAAGASWKSTWQHAAPRAGGGRKRRPARKPAGAAARPPHRACPASIRWPPFQPATEKVAITAAPLAEGFTGTTRAAPLDPVHHRDRALRHAPQARRRRKQEQTSDVDALIKDLSELKVGDPVVHANHGIGRYQGLINIDLGDGHQRVPAPGVRRQGHAVRAGGAAAPDQPLHRRQRRRSAAAQAGLSGQWDKAKRKAAEQVRDTAAELLNLYARRAAREGFATASARTTTKPSPPASASRKHPTSAPPSTP
jgi:hypothetical protein